MSDELWSRPSLSGEREGEWLRTLAARADLLGRALRAEPGLVGRLVSNPGFLEHLFADRKVFLALLKTELVQNVEGVDRLLAMVNTPGDGAALTPVKANIERRLARLLSEERRAAELFRREPELVEALAGNVALTEALMLRPKVYDALLTKARERFKGDKETTAIIAVAQSQLTTKFTSEGTLMVGDNHNKQMALMDAVRDSKVSDVRKLLEEGVDPNWPWSGDQTALTPANRTALMEAATQGNLEIVQMLLSNGANPLVGKPGWRARDFASHMGNWTVFDALVRIEVQAGLLPGGNRNPA